ncbi:hypothetical protein RND81_10G190200 [Saponaria officinalis]|uniref:Uncharacterized protein n=1 Tax=Saponaria officinalis TaxID=3572 RepID=A0AAW1I6J6_SAPOF
MVGKEDASSSWGQYQFSSDAPKKFWRSASWSSSRTAGHNPDIDDKDNVDSNGNLLNNGVVGRRFPAPLTPRSQQNCKARSCLPPLQPLSIARRSLDEWPKAGSDDLGEWPGPPTPSGRDVNKCGERLKLDMSAIQRSSDKNGGILKKDKIASFDKECSKVAEHIYLGGDVVARDKDILKKNGITHVLNCVGFVCPEYFKADFVYRTLWLQDSPSEDITSILYDVFDYFEDVREQKGRVFVHCFQGVSRSTSLVIAYLMWREGQSFDDAFQFVKEARGIADPNMGFACQLLQCQKRVHAVPLSPSSLLRVYRIAPHSPYDPLHLVPKMLNDPCPSALDSRGAFIIQIPSAIYVWVGEKCEVILEKEARGAVSQIVRYERVQVPAHVIKEGEEPSFFWEMLSDFVIEKASNGVRILVKKEPGERKVDLYDVDFEIVEKAIKGGFVPPVASSEAEHETHLPARENSWSLLRRKFASGHMKEFVSGPKLVVGRLLSDFRPAQCGDNNVASVPFLASSSPSSLSSSTLSSSTLSPPYLSPDSFSSDSSNNSKCSSESPLESPLSLSSTISTLSNMSLLSSKNCTSVSNNSDYIEVDFGSQPIKSMNSSSRRSPLSIAERRGSLSKSLRLPVVAGDGRLEDSSADFYVDKQADGIINDASCISFELDKQGMIADSSKSSYDVALDSTKLAFNDRPCENISSTPSVCGENRENNSSSLTETLSVSTGAVAVVSANCKPEQPSVYCLPNLEKVSVSGTCDFDPRSAFIVVAPEAACPGNDTNIYLWIGKFFSFDQSQIRANRKVADVDISHWKKIGSDALSRMNFPDDTNVKIIREGEEPADFLEVLSTL